MMRLRNYSVKENMELLHSLIYTSELSASQSPSCVTEIIQVSRRNNLPQGITGILIFDGINFCQYLEGEKSVIKSLLSEIMIDDRHTNFQLRFEKTETIDRRFSGWSIAYAVLSADAIDDRFQDITGKEALSVLASILPSLDYQPD